MERKVNYFLKVTGAVVLAAIQGCTPKDVVSVETVARALGTKLIEHDIAGAETHLGFSGGRGTAFTAAIAKSQLDSISDDLEGCSIGAVDVRRFEATQIPYTATLRFNPSCKLAGLIVGVIDPERIGAFKIYPAGFTRIYPS